MEFRQADLRTVERPHEEDNFLTQPRTSVRLRRIVRDGGQSVGGLVRCVSSGYLADGCSCDATIPLATVMAAWERQLDGHARKDGYFHFAWRDEVWLAYGTSDGRIRGVYCPAHAAERDERSFTGDVGPVPHGGKLPTTA